MFFTHKLLLEWNSSRSSEGSGQSDLRGFYQSMWIAPAFAVAMASGLVVMHPDVLKFVWTLLVSWSLAPAVAWWISLPLDTPRAKLREDQSVFLRKLSRKTWRFFETFVGPESHWLPPDNYQEKPRSVTANGTSPTNMGLSLLANLVAYDFGYISTGKLIERNASTLASMLGLERFKGHFYNWYDIKLQEPMQPQYVSTVDSGNLSGHLLTLQQGMIELMDRKILPEQTFDGLRDTLLILRDAVTGGESTEDGQEQIASMQLLEEIDRLRSELSSPPDTLSAAWLLLDQQLRNVSELLDLLGP
jgi:hypothetical protein